MSTIDFNNSFNRLTPSLQAFAMNLTRNSEEAEDLYQETAFRAYKNKEKFTPGTNFKAWLMTIMKNIFINNYRKKVKENTMVDQTDNQYYIHSGNVIARNGGDSNIFLKELHRLIQTLDENIKTPFMMYFEGYKYQEIAEQFNLPLGTVKSRIFFARREMKKLLKKHYGSFALVRE